jgi:hypothetical protein
MIGVGGLLDGTPGTCRRAARSWQGWAGVALSALSAARTHHGMARLPRILLLAAAERPAQ